MNGTLAPIFAALGDETRLLLLSRLAAQPLQSIARLSAGSAMTRQAITKHLRTLQAVGLVHSMRRGRETVFQLQCETLRAARQALDRLAEPAPDGGPPPEP